MDHLEEILAILNKLYTSGEGVADISELLNDIAGCLDTDGEITNLARFMGYIISGEIND